MFYIGAVFSINMDDINIEKGSVAEEWLAHRTRNPAVPDFSPAFKDLLDLISRSSRVQILGHACK